MAVGKGPAGAGLEVACEFSCELASFEGDVEIQFPGSVFEGAPVFAGVVLVETAREIRRGADVVGAAV